ncbi:MAG TPA: DciA family protein [Vampirovibrionales bacterium]
MAFNSLDHLLGALAAQTLGQQQREYQQLLEAWAIAVGPKINQYTRPLTVERGVLRVATSSAAWAQNLMFERRRILQRLNVGRSEVIADIRFSPKDWVKSDMKCPDLADQEILWQDHPSRLAELSADAGIPKGSEVKNAQGAFDRWAAGVQARSLGLPLCPHCGCPTPPGELARWEVCALCAPKQW